MKTRPSSLVPRYRRLLGRRGAAMVEASIVVFTCMVFWGVIRVVHSANSSKLALKSVTRHNAFSMAIKNCSAAGTPAAMPQAYVDLTTSNNGDISIDSAVNTGTGGAVADTVDNAAPSPNQPSSVAGGGGKSTFMASSVAGTRPLTNAIKRSELWGSTKDNTVFDIGVSAKSYVACNEEPRGGDLVGFIEYVVQNIEAIKDAVSAYQ